MKSNKEIKICHVAYSDILGGAARAAYRIHSALNNNKNLEIISSMRVIKKFSKDKNIIGGLPNSGLIKFYLQKYLNKISRYIFSIQYPEEKVYSIAWPNTNLGKDLNQDYKERKFDILNLHYLADNTLSIKEIGDLKMPIVWRLNDQWPFCSCEHYYSKADLINNIDKKNEYILGYESYKKLFNNFFDIKKIIWQHKKNSWNRKINIVAPTKWIANCAKKSYLFKNQPINIIPSAIDLEFWAPIPRKEARAKLNILQDKKVLLFGALGGTRDLRKGGDLLLKALQIIKKKVTKKFLNKIQIVIFGQDKNDKVSIKDFNVICAGNIENDYLLRQYYSASDVFILPSRIDNLPGTGIESHACGTPVIAFDVGGLSEIIEENVTGFLVKPFDVEILAKKILCLIEKKDITLKMGKEARKRAIKIWDQEKISKKYADLYSEIYSIEKEQN